MLVTKVLLFFVCFGAVMMSSEPPHIVFIVADDLGWNDVGFHGSLQIPTPNIDALAYSGVILNNYYVQPICTPSRSAIMTAMHPIHTGLQCYTIGGAQPYGLPLTFQTLPQYLGALGYVPKHVGKWHLGCYKKEFTPTYRGFETHYGYWTGRIDYYDHTAFETPGWWGYDFRRNMSVDRSAYGKYATDLFTDEAVSIIEKHNTSSPLFLYLAHLAVHSANAYDPLQAPAEVVSKFEYITDPNRKKFAGMLWKLDESIGKVVTALSNRGMLQDTIIIFTTDNGGPAAGFNSNAASNWPFRGVKAGLWEGGVRGAAFVWSTRVSKPGRVSQRMVQVIDWLPTLLTAAGGNSSALGHVDGVDVWDAIANDSPSRRAYFLHNIDPMINGAALRVGDWKILFNPSPYEKRWNLWFGPSGRNETAPETQIKEIFRQILTSPSAQAIRKIYPNIFLNMKQLRLKAQVLCQEKPLNATLSCANPRNPCLFHIPSDPCEYYDVSKYYPAKVKVLQEILNKFNASAVPPGNKPWDRAANPVFWEYTWTNWKDYPTPPLAQLVEGKQVITVEQ